MFRQRRSSCYSATLPHKRPVLMVLAKPAPAAMVAVHKQQAQGVRCQPGQTASFVPPVGLAECQCMGGRVARQPQYSRAVLSNCISSRANFARASVITERAKFLILRSCKSIIWVVESTWSWCLPLLGGRHFTDRRSVGGYPTARTRCFAVYHLPDLQYPVFSHRDTSAGAAVT